MGIHTPNLPCFCPEKGTPVPGPERDGNRTGPGSKPLTRRCEIT